MNDNQFNITIDSSVYKRIKELNAQDGNQQLMLRIRVNAGGCSGFAYEYDLVENIEPDDFVVTQDGVKVLIDKLSQNFIKNSIVKYEEELGRSYFKIINPSAQQKCGCGNSFAI